MSFVIRQNPADSHNFTPGREVEIGEIVVHHAATTDFDGIGATFKNPNRAASAHYGVGRNQNVDQYVQEEDTAWGAGDWGHNQKAVNIENVNMTGGPDWLIDNATFDTLVELVHDIAQRHNLLPLVVGQNLFGHKDVSDAATACPMALEPRLQELAAKVNSGSNTPNPIPAPNVPDQILHIGEKFQFSKAYRVDALAFVGGIWQIQCAELCPKGFTWNDNGIPTGPVLEVAGGAGNPNDQVLQVGSLFQLPGTFEVLNLGQSNGEWLAEISDGGWKFWVDIATVTEV
jgi:ferredoxin